MINYNPLLCLDFYKTAHANQYPSGLTRMVSYYTPRMTRLNGIDKLPLFGLQAFIQEYLIEAFNRNFFSCPFDEVYDEYCRVMQNTVFTSGIGFKRFMQLHKLGYLPLEIRAVPEGTRTDIRVPQIEISNTHPDFVWLVNSIETMLSCTMWHTQISAEIGYLYRQIINEYADRTCDDTVSRARLLGDFSMRGQESVESATKTRLHSCSVSCSQRPSRQSSGWKTIICAASNTIRLASDRCQQSTALFAPISLWMETRRLYSADF